MTVPASLDLLYFILAIAAVWIGVMLTWLLFEAALFARRVNRVVKGGIDKLRRVEELVSSIRDRLEASSGYLGILAKGGEALMGYMGNRVKKGRRRKDEEEEE